MRLFQNGCYGGLSWEEMVEQGKESWQNLQEGVEEEGKGYVTEVQESIEEELSKQGQSFSEEIQETVKEQVKGASEQMAKTHAETLSESLWKKAKPFVWLGAGLATVLTVSHVAKRR